MVNRREEFRIIPKKVADAVEITLAVSALVVSLVIFAPLV